MRLEPGARLGPYEIVEPIGAGGMGEVVYRVRDSRLGRSVALKVLRAVRCCRSGSHRAVRARSEIGFSPQSSEHRHDFDIGLDGTTPYIAMEFVEGSSLREPGSIHCLRRLASGWPTGCTFWPTTMTQSTSTWESRRRSAPSKSIPISFRGYLGPGERVCAQGLGSQGENAFLKAQELDPGDGGALSNIAVLESEVLGRHDEALAWARRLLQIPPITSNTISHIAWPMLILRDDGITERWVSEGIRRAADFPRLQYLQAALHHLQGDPAADIAETRRIVDEHPAFEEGVMVNAELPFSLRRRMQRR